MKLHEIGLTSRSITIELVNKEAYYTKEVYDIFVNEVLTIENGRKNIISFFGLEPDVDYKIELVLKKTGNSYQSVIRTKKEYVRLNVKRFGAKGDGKNLDSLAIQAAILSCPVDGTVYVPKGTYYCAPLFLKSNMTLELEEGATLLGYIDKDFYPSLPGYTITTDETDEYYIGTWEGNPLTSHASLITGIQVENVSIIGKGTIDGNAQMSDWWLNPKVKRDIWRPRTVFFNGCKNMMIQGVTVQNSPSWTIHPYLSTNLKFIDLQIINDKNSPNTDGLDPESCCGVEIIGVDFSVGDDCIAIKSGKLYMGRRLKTPSEKIEIRNCRMRHGHGAVVIGSEMSGGARDIKVSHCVFEKTDRGLRIKTRRGRGMQGVIDNIKFEYIKMNEVLTPFVMNMFYFCDPDGKSEYVWSKESLPLDEFTPLLGRFEFNHIDCDGSEWAAGYFMGLPEQPIQEILMKDIHIKFKENSSKGHPAMMSNIALVNKQGIVANYVNKLSLENVRIDGYEGDKLIISNVNELIEK